MESFKASVPEQENSTPFMAVLSKMISRGFSAETKFESIKKKTDCKAPLLSKMTSPLLPSSL
jgi:hypothetical protein